MLLSSLPRSLDPLPDESLSGYVLRLSHRLALPPGWLMQHTGIGNLDAHGLFASNSALATALPEDVTTRVARTTRLHPDEVTALTLACWNGRYPPITRAIEAGGRRHAGDWLFRSTARYCPECLAGDGSVIQQQHGGPWKKSWRLPVVFACLEHRRYLRYGCPGCHQAPDASTGSRLVARIGDASLHPVQCRNPLRFPEGNKRTGPACGIRLDQQIVAVPTRPFPDMVALQAQILRHLSPDISKREASEYFTDLQLIAALVVMTWPEAKHQAPLVAGNIADSYLRNLAARPTASRRIHRFTELPVGSAAAAALLRIAQSVLDRDDLRSHLVPLVLRDRTMNRTTTWSERFVGQQDACSSRLREAGAPLTHAISGGLSARRSPAQHDGFAPEQVPAFLPKSWADQYLQKCSGVSQRILRRTASVRLAQMAMGGSLDQAADFLGIHAPTSATGAIRRWAHLKLDVFEFDTALHALATALDVHAPDLPDYRHRRQTLRNWYLDEQSWRELTTKVPPSSTTPAHYDDLKRHIASIFVWSRITQGEHLFAPRPMEASQNLQKQKWWESRRNTMWCLLVNPGVSPHYSALGELLTEYADQHVNCDFSR
ncbi:TniQ family protein [Streptomyces sp. NPDC041068]|uniref:TniQ family protein n=1 Tax=Streptomyces sp. NPDC041068 TaxID=3155130 RepID=UPI0033D7190F